MFRNLITALVLAIVVAACSKSGHNSEKLFYGECKVSVKAQPAEAEIFVDGIPVGHVHAKVDIPCGEKQIMVEHHGFRPFYQYLKVTKEKPLEVSVNLERERKIEDYALSRELVEQVREGKKLRNPFKEGEGTDAKAGLEEKETEAAPLSLELGVGTEASTTSSGGTLPPGDIHSVDYWR